MKRRAISLLLAACMMCGLLTVGASAASSDATGAVETMKRWELWWAMRRAI